MSRKSKSLYVSPEKESWMSPAGQKPARSLPSCVHHPSPMKEDAIPKKIRSPETFTIGSRSRKERPCSHWEASESPECQEPFSPPRYVLHSGVMHTTGTPPPISCGTCTELYGTKWRRTLRSRFSAGSRSRKPISSRSILPKSVCFAD